MGRDVPAVGTVRRICSGTRRFGDVRVMGAIDMVGVAALTGILLDRPMRACSRRGSEVDCIVANLVIVLMDRCLVMVVAKLPVDL